MAAGAEGVHFLDQHGAAVDVEGEELLNHLYRLGVADDFHLGIAQNQLLNGAAVVGLHVVDDEIVQPAPVKYVGDVFEELVADALVNRVQQDGFLVQQYVGVVGNAPGDGVDVLKQRQTAVVCADPVQVGMDGLDTIHAFSSFNAKPCGDVGCLNLRIYYTTEYEKRYVAMATLL